MTSPSGTSKSGSQELLNNGFIAVGDIMLGDSAACVGFGFHSRYQGDAAPAFSLVAPLLQRGEIVFGNLEGVLAPKPRDATRYRGDQMRGEPAYATALRSAGFTALAIANNHAMQHGRPAFESTVRSLGSAGISCVGLRGSGSWCSDPVVQMTRSGRRVGLLGYCWRPRQYDAGEPPYAEGDVDAVIRDIVELRRTTKSIVVSLHWGEEFVGNPSVAESDAAHRMIDAGASVVVGHHPHVLRPVERYGKGLICYSLGNFVTDMVWQPKLRTGAILECELDSEEIWKIRVMTTRVDNSYRPTLAETEVKLETQVIAMPEADYRNAVTRSVRLQQFASYRYAATHVSQYHPSVLAELVSATLRNKLAAITPIVRADSTESMQEMRPACLSILHVVAPAEFGGLESVLHSLAVGQAARGHSVRVVVVLSPRNEPHSFVTALQRDQVETIQLFIGDRNYLAEYRAIRSICRRFKPDVLHTHGFRSDIVAALSGRANQGALVSTCHGFIESSRRVRFYQWLQRRMLRRFDAVVAVSRPILARLRESGVAQSAIHLVPNAFTWSNAPVSREDARHALGVSDTLLVGWVGRLSTEKGPDLALEAFAQLGIPEARLVMIGDGPRARELEARAKSLGISDRVSWLGAVPDAGRLLGAFDVFLLSSRTEGTPMVLLEAMAARVPIVATRVGGVPDVVDESIAVLVENEDSVAMATALSEVLADLDAARERAARGLKTLDQKFSADAWQTRYDSVYLAARRRCQP